MNLIDKNFFRFILCGVLASFLTLAVMPLSAPEIELEDFGEPRGRGTEPTLETIKPLNEVAALLRTLGRENTIDIGTIQEVFRQVKILYCNGHDPEQCLAIFRILFEKKIGLGIVWRQQSILSFLVEDQSIPLDLQEAAIVYAQNQRDTDLPEALRYHIERLTKNHENNKRVALYLKYVTDLSTLKTSNDISLLDYILDDQRSLSGGPNLEVARMLVAKGVKLENASVVIPNIIDAKDEACAEIALLTGIKPAVATIEIGHEETITLLEYARRKNATPEMLNLLENGPKRSAPQPNNNQGGNGQNGSNSQQQKWYQENRKAVTAGAFGATLAVTLPIVFKLAGIKLSELKNIGSSRKVQLCVVAALAIAGTAAGATWHACGK